MVEMTRREFFRIGGAILGSAAVEAFSGGEVRASCSNPRQGEFIKGSFFADVVNGDTGLPFAEGTRVKIWAAQEERKPEDQRNILRGVIGSGGAIRLDNGRTEIELGGIADTTNPRIILCGEPAAAVKAVIAPDSDTDASGKPINVARSTDREGPNEEGPRVPTDLCGLKIKRTVHFFNAPEATPTPTATPQLEITPAPTATPTPTSVPAVPQAPKPPRVGGGGNDDWEGARCVGINEALGNDPSPVCPPGFERP